MNTAASPFTPLESLLLFQSILRYGFDPQAFAHISASLRNNSFIQSDESYNADRLSSESLQQLFLHLLRDELKGDEHSRSNGGTLPTPGSAASTGDGNLSPNSRKRKLPSPALPTLSDVHAHVEKLPALVGRLYARYRNLIVASIREDERQLEQIQGEIHVLERAEEEEEEEKEKQRTRQASAGPADAGKRAAAADGEASTALPATAPRPADGEAQKEATPQPPSTAALLPAAGTLPQPPAASAKPSSSPVQTAKPETTKPTPPAASLPAATSQITTESAPSSKETSQTRPTPPRSLQTAVSAPEPGPAAQASQSPHIRSSSIGPLAPLQPVQGPATPSPAEDVAPGIPSASGKPRSQTPPDSQPGAAEKAPSPTKPAQAPTTPQKLPPSQLPPQRPPTQTASPVRQPPPATAQSLPGPSTPTPRTGSGIQKPTHASSTPAPPPLVPQAVLRPSAQASTPAAAAAEAQPEAQRPVLPAVKPAHIPIQPQPDRHVQRQGAPVGAGQQVSATPVRATPAPSASTQGNAAGHANRSVLLQHVQTPSGSVTPTPTQAPRPHLPHTPAHMPLGGFLPRGSGTRWKSNEPTPSTPGPDVGGIASPAYEPLSPVLGSTGRSTGAESNQRQQQRQAKKPYATKGGHKHETTGSRPRGRPPRNPKPQVEAAAAENGHASQPNIKNEASTPQAFDDIGETTTEEGGGAANESSTVSPSGRSSRPLKRKREESVDFASPDKPLPLPLPLPSSSSSQMRRRLLGPGAAVPPTHVLWMRGFPKISASALDQISSHRSANMFAHRIRDRDAPGYDSIVRHPVDLKMVRMAIMQGNKAATAAAAGLPESEQSSSSTLWLPISEELVPPRGIINSSQLECELVHMFANAIMYNPDSHRGPGLAFMESEATEEDTGPADAGGGGGNSARYKVDEDGVVNDTRGMYIEVEKLLSEMRSAERQRGVPPLPASARGVGVDASAEVDAEPEAEVDDGGGDGDGDRDGADATEDDEEAGADEEADGGNGDGDGSGATKRRRIARGQ